MDSDTNFDEFKDISLSEVKVFFPKKAFEVLLELEIENLGDLFLLENNGELEEMFFKKHKEAHETWSQLKGSIVILKCKYLNIDPGIDFNDRYKFIYQIGLKTSVRKRMSSSKSLQMPNILDMVESNDYSTLYYNFDSEVVDEIKNKIQVLYNYHKKQNEITLDDLHELYDELARLVKEHQRISSEIGKVQEEINRKLNGGKKI